MVMNDNRSSFCIFNSILPEDATFYIHYSHMLVYVLLAEGPWEKNLIFFLPIAPPRPIGPAVWLAICNIYIYIYECLVLLYRYL